MFVIYTCLFGLVFAILMVFLNINLVLKVVLKKSKRVDEMMIFYYRFVLDILFGLSLILYISFIFFLITYPESPYHQLIVITALPSSNIAACRSIIALSISLERLLATSFPLKYRSYRPHIPNLIILSIGILFGLSEWPVLFGFCSYQISVPPNCRVFSCAINQCFHRYWTGHKSVIFFIIVILSVLLSIRLLIWNRSKTSQKLSRANRLALLDTVTVLFFDFVPSFCASQWPQYPLFKFDNVGPYIAAGTVLGCAIEAGVVTTVILPRRSQNQISESKIQAFQVTNH